MEKLGVYEPLVVNKQLIKSATEAANMILKIDDMIASGKTKMPSGPGECMWDAAWRIWWNATRILTARSKGTPMIGAINIMKNRCCNWARRWSLWEEIGN